MDTKGRGVGVAHGVGSSVEDGRHGPMSSGTHQDIDGVGKHVIGPSKGGVWHHNRHHGVSAISNKEGD